MNLNGNVATSMLRPLKSSFIVISLSYCDYGLDTKQILGKIFLPFGKYKKLTCAFAEE